MATDQEIRDAGFKYVPQQKYLLNPFELPENQEPVTNSGIVNTNAFTGGGGGGFGVFNPDPNSIVNRDYQPNYDYRRFSEYGSDPSTMNIKQMDMNQNYFYEPPPSKMEGLLSMLPYVGSLTRGAKFLGNQISPYLPVNRRSILENELGGKGIMVDNIGRIVQGQGDYNTAENIMAGYNANNLTQKSVDKRQGTIEKTLADKYKMSTTDIDAVKAGTYKGPVESDLIDRYKALNEFGNTLDLTNTRTDKIYDFEKDEKEKKKDSTIIGRYLTKKKEKKAIKAAKDDKDSSGSNNVIITPSNNKTGGGGYVQPKGSYDTDKSTGGSGDHRTMSSRSYDTDKSTGGSGDHRTMAKGGRAGYFFGGRVNFKNGGLASIL